jgi:Xaa-Pro aminopeptidase
MISGDGNKIAFLSLCFTNHFNPPATYTGTGHGVGAALNVHEGPQRISRALDGQALMSGMVVSNEPGYYEEDNKEVSVGWTLDGYLSMS